MLSTLDSDRVDLNKKEWKQVEQAFPKVKKAIRGSQDALISLLDAFVEQYGLDIGLNTYGEVGGLFFADAEETRIVAGSPHAAYIRCMANVIASTQE